MDAVQSPWVEKSDPIELFAVLNVLLAVTDGSWVSNDHVRDLFRVNDFHIRVTGNLVVTIRLLREYPDTVQLVRIGPFES